MITPGTNLLRRSQPTPTPTPTLPELDRVTLDPIEWEGSQPISSPSIPTIPIPSPSERSLADLLAEQSAEAGRIERRGIEDVKARLLIRPGYTPEIARRLSNFFSAEGIGGPLEPSQAVRGGIPLRADDIGRLQQAANQANALRYSPERVAAGQFRAQALPLFTQLMSAILRQGQQFGFEQQFLPQQIIALLLGLPPTSLDLSEESTSGGGGFGLF